MAVSSGIERRSEFLSADKNRETVVRPNFCDGKNLSRDRSLPPEPKKNSQPCVGNFSFILGLDSLPREKVKTKSLSFDCQDLTGIHINNNVGFGATVGDDFDDVG